MKKVELPKRIVITSGMPYGNKDLHLGHISGFIFSDFFARYMRDRIGANNVLYICGTDCYGSPAEENYRKLKEAGKFSGSLNDFVSGFNVSHKKTLADYSISLNDFYASALPPAYDDHFKISEFFFTSLLN